MILNADAFDTSLLRILVPVYIVFLCAARTAAKQ